MKQVLIVGCGFVADLYMRSLETFPDIKVRGAFDVDSERLFKFTEFWNIKAANSFTDLCNMTNPEHALILNLTNPREHYKVSMAALESGFHVYSEKPLAMDMEEAYKLTEYAKENQLFIGSAPCSWMSETAETLKKAINSEEIGRPKLVYAELDDGYISKMPYQSWLSESGAPWPWKDEFEVGCTMEHAGYYVTWLCSIFGAVDTVTSMTSILDPEKLPANVKGAPDYSTALLKFKSGVVARLTCSIIAAHDHSLRVFGEKGIIQVKECWDNHAPVKIRKKIKIRRKVLDGYPLKVKPVKTGLPKVKKRGAAAMNFAIGPAEMLAAISSKKEPALTSDFSLHVTEVSLAVDQGANKAGEIKMQSKFDRESLSRANWCIIRNS